MVLNLEALLEEDNKILPVIEEIKAKPCGKDHECVRGSRDPFSKEATDRVNNAVEKCVNRMDGLNACCAHDSFAIDLLKEQLESIEEGGVEAMIDFLNFHKEAMEALDGIRIAFESGNGMESELNGFNSFVETDCVDLSESDLGGLLFSSRFIKEQSSNAIVAAIKIREVILGKKVESIRDYILEYFEDLEDKYN